MNVSGNHTEAEWEQVAPMLDEAMQKLGAEDRDALVLRFFEGRNLRSVGSALGVTEDAAQKRVARAVERLRFYLNKRGATLSATGLTALLVSHGVISTPPGLAGTVASAVLAGTTTGSGSGILCWELLRPGLAKVLPLAIAAGLALPLVRQHRALNELRSENRRLQAEASALRQENARLGATPSDTEELERLRQEHLELLRLRNLVSMLQKQNRPAPVPASEPARNEAPVGSLVQVLNIGRYEAAQAGSKLTLTGTSSVGPWSVQGSVISGFFELDISPPATTVAQALAGAATNGIRASCRAAVPVKSLKSMAPTGASKMNSVMLGALKVGQHNFISFTLVELAPKPHNAAERGRRRPATFESWGDLAVAGVTNRIQMDVTIELPDRDRLKIAGSKPLKMTDFGVTPPGGPFGTKVADDVLVAFEWVVAPGSQGNPNPGG